MWIVLVQNTFFENEYKLLTQAIRIVARRVSAVGAQVETELKAIAPAQVQVSSVLITSAGNSGNILVHSIAHVVLGFSKQLQVAARADEFGAAITKCLDQLALKKTFRRVIFTTLFNDVRSLVVAIPSITE